MYKIYGVVLFFGALSNTNFAFRFIIFYLFTFFEKEGVSAKSVTLGARCIAC